MNGKSRALYDKLSHVCEGNALSDVGTACSLLCIDMALRVGMPKNFFLSMMAEAWDMAEEQMAEDEVKH